MPVPLCERNAIGDGYYSEEVGTGIIRKKREVPKKGLGKQANAYVLQVRHPLEHKNSLCRKN